MKGEPDKKFLFTQINIIEGVDIENQLFYQIQTFLSDKILQVCGIDTFIINCCCNKKTTCYTGGSKKLKL